MNKLTRTILLLLLSAAVLPSFAQSMRIVGFRHLETDMTAKVGEGRLIDDNGDLAALIKVVAPIDGLHFDGDFYGIVGQVERKGAEYWVYVPASSATLSIGHANYATLRNYAYPEHIKGGETYEMLVDIGQGQFLTLNSSRAGAELTLDGKPIGKAPITNYYMLYGSHTLEAIEGRWEGSIEFIVSANDTLLSRQPIVVPMADQTPFYGQGRITVDGQAEIYFQGQRVGRPGSWDFDLRQGNYEVETQKADCEPERTIFTVKPGAQGNDVKAKAPTPHTGWLQVVTRPRVVSVTDNGQPISLLERQTLPVGTHDIYITRKGFHPKQIEYVIERDKVITDTIQLERISYVKPTAFYFGVGYTLRSLSGLTALAGYVYHNHDLQLSYTFGTASSSPVYWYDGEGVFQSGVTYKLNSLCMEYGYQMAVLPRVGLTPQVGYRVDMLSGSLTHGSVAYGGGARAQCLSLGLKVQAVPAQHIYVFAKPAYALALSKDSEFDTVATKADFAVGGFSVTAGVILNF